MQVLSDLNVGQAAFIGQLNVASDRQMKLLGLGINTGVRVGVLRNRGGDMVLALGNARVSVGRTLSRVIEVNLL